MSLYTFFFGQRRPVWQRIAQERGGTFHSPFLKGDRIEFPYRDWTVIFEYFHGGFNSQVGSRQGRRGYYSILGIPFFNPSGFDCDVRRANFLHKIGNAIGLADIRVGDPYFDETFQVRSNQPEQVRGLLASPVVKQALTSSDFLNLRVFRPSAWRGERSLPPGVSMLACELWREQDNYFLLLEIVAMLDAGIDWLYANGVANDFPYDRFLPR